METFSLGIINHIVVICYNLCSKALILHVMPLTDDCCIDYNLIKFVPGLCNTWTQFSYIVYGTLVL